MSVWLMVSSLSASESSLSANCVSLSDVCVSLTTDGASLPANAVRLSANSARLTTNRDSPSATEMVTLRYHFVTSVSLRLYCQSVSLLSMVHHLSETLSSNASLSASYHTLTTITYLSLRLCCISEAAVTAEAPGRRH